MTDTKGFTQGDIEQILRVVDGLADVEVWLETDEFKLHVRKFAGGDVPAGKQESARPAEPETPPSIRPQADERTAGTTAASGAALIPDGCVAIRAPMLGTFYRSSAPSEPPFAEVGTRVRASDPVCLLEVMKLFNTVNAGVDGTIVSIHAENGQMVQQDDVLFVVRAD